jgi:hypothetical protein
LQHRITRTNFSSKKQIVQSKLPHQKVSFAQEITEHKRKILSYGVDFPITLNPC